ncbi:MAG: GNAT family N-acetyltransferase [Parasporobacterium sp.]|nr:GNAT family N-acetyltransferase [Parasporobacterium sp.]
MHNEVLHRITRFEEIDQHQLMDLYAEGNAENTDYFYPEMADKKAAISKVEDDFLNYIRTEFLGGGNTYWVLEADGRWISALRLYPLEQEFYYLEALETHPAFRQQGYASKLLNAVISELKKTGSFVLCDCVSKKNMASIQTHLKCGFIIASEDGIDYLTGEADSRDYGMRYEYRKAAQKSSKAQA